MKIETVYLSGQMSGLPDFGKGNFFRAEGILKRMGIAVINPAILPDGWEWEKYMQIAYESLRQNRPDYIVMLPGWRKSAGATQEYCWARELGIKIIEWDCLMDKRELELLQSIVTCTLLRDLNNGREQLRIDEVSKLDTDLHKISFK